MMSGCTAKQPRLPQNNKWQTLPLKRAVSACLLAMALGNITNAIAADPVIKTTPKKSYAIPAGNLSEALPAFAAESGVLLGFDPAMTQGKRTNGLYGSYGLSEGFSTLLQGTGLEVVNDEKGALILQKSPIAANSGASNLPIDVELGSVTVRAPRFYEIGPLGGTGLTKEQIPGNVQSLTAQDIKDAHALSITDLMNSKLQSVNVNDYQGNPFQMDVQYRGFTAGPEIGTPQGLAVFMDGIRVNEPFGDVVNWDMLPLNALSSFDVIPGSNPIFGLGALGGAISMKTKDGFNNPGVDAELLTGSFGRKQLQASGGWNNGTVGLFGAGSFFYEDGWRDNSRSKVNQAFGKASYRGEQLDLSFSSLVVWNDLIGNGLISSEMYKQDRSSIFTAPDTTDNRLFQFQLSGSYFVNDNFTVTAQAYRRKSKRHAVGADVYTDHQDGFFRRALNPGEQFTCIFNSNNEYGLPDYYVLDSEPGGDLFSTPFVQDLFTNFPNYDLSLLNYNAPLPDYYVAYVQSQFNVWKNYRQALLLSPQAGTPTELPPGDSTPYSNGESSYIANYNGTAFSTSPPGEIDPVSGLFLPNYYYTPDGIKHQIFIINPVNGDDCTSVTVDAGAGADSGTLSVLDPNTGSPLTVDGASSLDGKQPGVVEGTPTAVLTNTDIDQITDGASVQFNWNYPKHKFMVGVSIDAPSAKYRGGQRLGLMDAQRNVFLAPDQIRDQYTAADQEIHNNDFKGSQVTKSIYASETWSPIETLHITGSARYNDTHGKNKIASRTFGSHVWDLSQLENVPDDYNVCLGTWPDCANNPSTGYYLGDVTKLLNAPEKERFSYYSLNPSLGVTWQAKPDLNIYGNWAQGTRTPSVIELGCAFDDTPVNIGTSSDPRYIAKSLQENRTCSLPSTLSGDPYLPQVKANTWDIGIRGQWGESTEWNLGAYQTDLRDDIYLVSFPGNRSYFASIGDTRRRGIEAGITTTFGKARLRLNYALTDATFQERFLMTSNDNSSSFEATTGNLDYGRLIEVKPGNRMPGVPLHNLNATLSYDITPAWSIGFTAVAHSMSYVRGNENNNEVAS